MLEKERPSSPILDALERLIVLMRPSHFVRNPLAVSVCVNEITAIDVRSWQWARAPTSLVDAAPASSMAKERTLEQLGFGRSQHGYLADNIVAQTPLLSPAEIWRR
ncbi:MAG: hypothetical protein JO141_19140 [Bradyrhizobium sp.]|nr:hypothetical protein [Bradyrhizobium sp.]